MRWTLPLVVALLVGVVGGIAVAAAIHIPEVENQGAFTPSQITRVVGVDGEVFAQFARERRILMDETEVPAVLQNAIVAVEDSRFFQHGGVDAEGILRAVIANLRAGGIEEGASTLTMQLARTLFLTRDQTLKRKIEEAFTAVELEKRYSKQQLLTLYCNLMNVGHGNYGFAQASRYYFDKPVQELEAHEAAMLAGIVQLPSVYSPYRKPDLVRKRRDLVLRRMRTESFLTEEEYRAAVAKPLGVVLQRNERAFAPYFGEEVRKYIEQTYSTQQLLEGGLQVVTTLDPKIQHSTEAAVYEGLRQLDRRKGWRGPSRHLEASEIAAAELDSWTDDPPLPERWYEGIVLESDARKAVVKIATQTYTLTSEGMEWTRRREPRTLLKAGDVAWFRLEPQEIPEDATEGETLPPRLMLEQQPELQAAALVLESTTGAVRAMVGGWDFSRSKFNRITQARRQVGSAFKPFVWGAALESGYTPADTLFDAPTYFNGAENTPTYRPRNFSRQYYGIVTLRRAMEKSLNLTAVKLLDMVGVDRTIDFARRCGVESNLLPVPSLALGVAEMPPLELAAAYAAIANQGTYVRPYFIERVTSPTGRILEEHHPETRGAMEPEIGYLLTHILEGVIDRGTGTALNGLNLDLAGKTGTTDNFTDAWFVGFSPRYTLLSWVGYDTPRSIGRNMTGAEAAVPIWKAMAGDGLETGWLQEGETFSRPPQVTLAAVERSTGLLPLPGYPQEIIEEAFLLGTEPARTYDPQWDRILELPWYQQRPFYLPKENERMPEDFEDVARVDDWTEKKDEE